MVAAEGPGPPVKGIGRQRPGWTVLTGVAQIPGAADEQRPELLILLAFGTVCERGQVSVNGLDVRHDHGERGPGCRVAGIGQGGGAQQLLGDQERR